MARQGSLGSQASPAGLLPTQPRAAWSDLTSHGWVFLFFSPAETRLLSKSSCLKVSQSETACFNSQKPFGFLHCDVSTSLHFLWWQRPQRLRSATLPVCCIDDFQMKTPVISLPSSLTQYLQICKSYTGGPCPVIPSTVDMDFHSEQK